MTLLAGIALDPKSFFEGGNPQVQGSSFDLTIGCIFDPDGKKVEGLFKIKPGHMVQVVSAEALKLSDSITGHVTYKTTMTRQGIWALTVGIVDPGWHGPISTTLLNFSRVDHAIAEGDPFLRVSLFQHDPVPAERLRKALSRDAYLKDIQKIAASRFPPTFLDTDNIAAAAGKNVLNKIRLEALGWVAGIAIVFTLLQIMINLFTGSRASVTDIDGVRVKLERMQEKLIEFERPARGSVSTPDVSRSSPASSAAAEAKGATEAPSSLPAPSTEPPATPSYTPAAPKQ
jgi:deoxycytidine triphosphate deaminase